MDCNSNASGESQDQQLIITQHDALSFCIAEFLPRKLSPTEIGLLLHFLRRITFTKGHALVDLNQVIKDGVKSYAQAINAKNNRVSEGFTSLEQKKIIRGVDVDGRRRFRQFHPDFVAALRSAFAEQAKEIDPRPRTNQNDKSAIADTTTPRSRTRRLRDRGPCSIIEGLDSMNLNSSSGMDGILRADAPEAPQPEPAQVAKVAGDDSCSSPYKGSELTDLLKGIEKNFCDRKGKPPKMLPYAQIQSWAKDVIKANGFEEFRKFANWACDNGPRMSQRERVWGGISTLDNLRRHYEGKPVLSIARGGQEPKKETDWEAIEREAQAWKAENEAQGISYDLEGCP